VAVALLRAVLAENFSVEVMLEQLVDAADAVPAQRAQVVAHRMVGRLMGDSGERVPHNVLIRLGEPVGLEVQGRGQEIVRIAQRTWRTLGAVLWWERLAHLVAFRQQVEAQHAIPGGRGVEVRDQRQDVDGAPLGFGARRGLRPRPHLLEVPGRLVLDLAVLEQVQRGARLAFGEAVGHQHCQHRHVAARARDVAQGLCAAFPSLRKTWVAQERRAQLVA
jgi:hypothetical protein